MLHKQIAGWWSQKNSALEEEVIFLKLSVLTAYKRSDKTHLLCSFWNKAISMGKWIPGIRSGAIAAPANFFLLK